MAFHVSNFPRAGGNTTLHVDRDHRSGHSITVSSHPPTPGWPTHTVTFGLPPHQHDLPNALIWTAGEERAIAGGEHAQPPSEHLRQLIAQHHEHPDQWPILLDALQEEYPQLHDAIEAHHAARRSSDAAQYARAFTTARAAR